MDDMYSDLFLDRYTHPLYRARLGENDHAQRIKLQNKSCGDIYTLYISLDGDTVRKCTWEGEGCVISTNAVDLFCEWCTGKTLKEVQSCTRETISDLVGIQKIAFAREKCLFLPLSCVFE